MPENKSDQHPQQPATNFVPQSTQHTSDFDPDKITVKGQEIEEWDEVITDQRRPQFRCSENFRRRNY